MTDKKFRVIDRGEVYTWRFKVEKKVWWWPLWISISYYYQLEDAKKCCVDSKVVWTSEDKEKEVKQ